MFLSIYIHTQTIICFLQHLHVAVLFFNMGTGHRGKKYVDVENVDIKTAVKIKLLKLFHLYQKGLDFCCALIFLPKQLLHFLGFLKEERP